MSSVAREKRKPGKKPQALQPVRQFVAHGLTALQYAFVVAYVRNGGNVALAAREAGYGGEYRNQISSAAVSEAIRREQARVIGSELGTIAIGTLRNILLDESARNSDRLTAVRLSFEAARFIGRAADNQARAIIPVAEMTAGQLDEMLADAARTLATLRNEARTIDGAASNSISEAQGEESTAPQG